MNRIKEGKVTTKKRTQASRAVQRAEQSSPANVVLCSVVFYLLICEMVCSAMSVKMRITAMVRMSQPHQDQ